MAFSFILASTYVIKVFLIPMFKFYKFVLFSIKYLYLLLYIRDQTLLLWYDHDMFNSV